MKFLRKPKRKFVVIEVEGGLGNTLFQYAAAKYLANRISADILVSKRHIGKAKTNHGFYLSNILPGVKFQEKNFLSRLWIMDWLISIYDSIIDRVARKSNTLSSLITYVFKSYHSNVIGFDANLDVINVPVNMRGYFQTWKYAETLFGHDGFIPQLEKSTVWYSEMSQLAKDVQPIVMHVRRGDYQDHGDRYGILSNKYYLNALQIIPDELRNTPIWVFSDEIVLAKQSLIRDLPTSTIWIDPPRNSNPAESFMLMTYGRAHIIANSTFSYWAAQFSLTSQLVIAPKKWFKQMVDPQDLMNPSWRLVDSEWV